MLSWLLFFVAVALIVWYYSRGPAAGQFGWRFRRQRVPQESPPRWQAVAVLSPRGARPCGAVRGFLNRRFLVREAPAIPVRDCLNPGCRCYYEHYDDRRQNDRRAGHGLHESVSAGLGISDRRTGRDRRRRPPIGSILPQ